MELSKSKINVAVGVLTGVLVGFVLGAAYGTPDSAITSNGQSKGNISELARYRYKDINVLTEETKADTLKLTAVDNEGQTWNIIMTK